MNRKERRQTEKYLGLTKHYQKMSRKAKLELISERIKSGKEKEQETKQNREKNINEQDEIKLNTIISHLAEHIAQTEKISLVEATEKATKEYSTYKK
jgi:hypothetical protein